MSIAKPQAERIIREQKQELYKKTCKFSSWSRYPVLLTYMHILDGFIQSCWISLIKEKFSSVFSDKPVTLKLMIGFNERDYGYSEAYNRVQLQVMRKAFEDTSFVDSLIRLVSNEGIRHDYMDYSGECLDLVVGVVLTRESLDTIMVSVRIQYDNSVLWGNIESVSSANFCEEVLGLTKDVLEHDPKLIEAKEEETKVVIFAITG